MGSSSHPSPANWIEHTFDEHLFDQSNIRSILTENHSHFLFQLLRILKVAPPIVYC